MSMAPGDCRFPTDDLGAIVPLHAPPRRVVSLVPSLTEAIAATCVEILVGATDWCTHPNDLDVQRVRGTKNPNLNAIRDLRPDLVVANKEENRALDVSRLRSSGVPVWVTDIRTVASALRSLHRLVTEALQVPSPEWLTSAEGEWSSPPPAPTMRVAIAVWRDPWLVVGRDTYIGDLARRLGWVNVFGEDPGRYPHQDLAEIDRAGADVVVLPDEPYEFTTSDGPEAFHATRTALCSGRRLTWYGPAMIGATRELRAAVELK